ncbi:NifB/NifX family molybdenum-iron cluster-binding protein [Nitratidesulfovibrio vulgaris]|uniref:NifB/NifX family molybdenum-iron cluster-binding protein n=1 Tax=Nitratidesulfovibrio vulgaris TaxID=881 RepID=UPI0023003B61|nr:dinitrogenase iron-molybdenum cofactor biosynthesis protein [Nitratidesulfovibrio vulgaris]WCB45630.1 dinitrogenase iron-molybdenum cofactor biosynthesis protein [Nitratidesulfovibrio vulgaris]
MIVHACLASYEGRLATLLETASALHFVRLDDAGPHTLHVRPFRPTTPMHLAATLLEADTHLLVCGGVCGRWLHTLEAQGVEVIPWLSGTEQEVLAALAKGTVDELVMPGCMRRLGTTGGVCVRARCRTRRERNGCE